MFKRLIAANHPTVVLDNFTILSSGYHIRKFKRKLEAYIKHNQTSVPRTMSPETYL